MIAHLHGTVQKLETGQITVDVQGVGYFLQVPLDTWDTLSDNAEAKLYAYTHVREDRLELFGFADWPKRMLFAECVKISGIGPALALELCSVPSALFMQAIYEQDASLLTNIKGIGRKKAEKLLLDLQSLLENSPNIFGTTNSTLTTAQYDQDAAAALTALGYDSSTVLHALKNVPIDVSSTEERVAAALRSL